jgi:hypothetical protein
MLTPLQILFLFFLAKIGILMADFQPSYPTSTYVDQGFGGLCGLIIFCSAFVFIKFNRKNPLISPPVEGGAVYGALVVFWWLCLGE